MIDKSWFERDREDIVALCREYTFTNWRDQGGWQPCGVITGGKGSYFWDANGNRYLDLSSQFMCVTAGHQHPKIINAIIEQAQQLCYVDPRYATAPRAELGRLLAEITPKNLTKVFLCMSGSDANENALKDSQDVHREAQIYCYLSFISWCLTWGKYVDWRIATLVNRTRTSGSDSCASTLLLSM